MFAKIRDALNLIEDSVLIALVVSMVVLSFSQLVLRNMGVSGMAWSDAALRVNVLWLAMFGALRASRLQNHIAIDVVTRYVHPKAQKTIHLLVSLGSAVICAIAAYYSYAFVMLEREDNAMAFLNVPVWVCEAVIPFALVVITARFLLNMFNLPEPYADQP